mmetsp:Transcript_51566/g.95416  ORF Transcript_51566/g.95416 Transcript_51566/m.95416 type:complete len:131 (+) Transcript_51566:104-496(+)
MAGKRACRRRGWIPCVLAMCTFCVFLLSSSTTCFAGHRQALQPSEARARDVSARAHKKPTKKGRKLVVLECTEQRQMVKDGVPGAGGPRGGVSRYVTEKNVRNTPELMELRKFNKFLGRYTVHRELKGVA